MQCQYDASSVEALQTGGRARKEERKHLPVIPQGTGSRGPLEADLDVYIGLVHGVQVVEDHVALRLVETDDAVRHGPVHPQRLPASGRVDADQGVRALDMLWAELRVVAVQVLVGGDVDGVLAVDDLAEVRGQLLVRRVSARPECVAAVGWDCVVVEMGDSETREVGTC